MGLMWGLGGQGFGKRMAQCGNCHRTATIFWGRERGHANIEERRGAQYPESRVLGRSLNEA